MKLLLCASAQQRLALPLNQVEKVVLRPALACLPEQPPWLAGFLALPETNLPVIDLAALFGGPPLPVQVYDPIVLTSNIGLLLQRVNQIIEVEPASVRPLSGQDTFQGLAAGLVHNNIPLLVPRLLLAHQQQERLLHWQDVLARRLEEVPA